MRTFMLTTLVSSLALVLVLFGLSITRRDRSKTGHFSVLCAGVALYLFGYILEVLSPNLDSAMTALKVQNAGIPIIGPFLLLATLSICQYKLLRPWMNYVFSIYSIGLTFVVMFNDYHHLYYTTVEFLPLEDMYYLVLGHGPLYFVQQGVVVVCTALAVFAFWKRMMVWPSKARKQMRYVILGVVVSFIINVLHFTRTLPWGIDPTPVSMTLALLFAMISFMKYKVMDILPIASETAVQSMDDAIIVLDTDWCYHFSNKAAVSLFPCLADFFGTEPVAQIEGWPRELLSPDPPTDIAFQIPLQGNGRHYRAHVKKIQQDNKFYGWSVVIRDVTETVELLDKLQTLAVTDSLTGIYNRRHFNEAAQRELELARREGLPASLVLFDLDHFKAINDTYGHWAGDEILLMVAEMIKRELRPYDLFARYGGEEFVLFSVGMYEEDAKRFAWRLCNVIEEAYLCHKDKVVQVTASFGIVQLMPEDTLEDAIIAADRAMYKAKRLGRNRVERGVIYKKQVKVQ